MREGGRDDFREMKRKVRAMDLGGGKNKKRGKVERKRRDGLEGGWEKWLGGYEGQWEGMGGRAKGTDGGRIGRRIGEKDSR